MNLLMALTNGDLPLNEDAWSIFTNPAHIIAELGWTIIQDVILVWLLYGTLWKKVILPKLHEKFDKEHKITHHEPAKPHIHIAGHDDHGHDHKI
jgi:hypothetical protein